MNTTPPKKRRIGFLLLCLLAVATEAQITDIVEIVAETPQAAPTYVVANPDSALNYVAIPLSPPSANSSRLTPVKITESGRVLLRNLPWQNESEVALTTPIAYRWKDGVFQTINHSPPWQSATTLQFYDDGTNGYNPYYTGQYINLADMNDAGDVIGYVATDWDNSVVNSPTGWGYFIQPAAWPANQSVAETISAFAPNRRQSGSPTSYRDPYENIPRFIADSGVIYGDFNDYGINRVGTLAAGAHRGLVRWETRFALQPVFSENSYTVAISPDGSRTLTADAPILGYMNKTYSVNGLTTLIPASDPLNYSARINNQGRFIINGKWGEPGLVPQAIRGLSTSVIAIGQILAINAKNDLLGRKPNGEYGIWGWHPFPIIVSSPIKGFYHERKTVFSYPTGWTLSGLTGSYTNAGLLLGTLRNTSQITLTTPAVLVPVSLSVDGDHDGVIQAHKLTDEVTAAAPYRFWSNDDDDNPGATFQADNSNNVVDGPNDLADFFPVFLDIKQLLTVLPPSATVKYKLKQADGKLNFVYTSLTRATAFDYQKAATATTGYGPNQNAAAHEAPTHQITATGIDVFELDPDLVTRIKDNEQGVILLEMYSRAAAPLKLVVEKDNVQIAEVVLNVVALERGPDVLRVNADFDEQKMGTTYAQPDYVDPDLRAASGPDAGQLITDDLHPGFYGIHPQTLPAEFYNGATVTIEKVPELDSETGQIETGEVRIHAIDASGVARVIPITMPLAGGGTTPPINLVPLLYAASPVVPRSNDTQFWIEGIKAGPITLRFSYTGGGNTFSDQQKFLVATHQTKAQWQEEIRQQILLQTSGAVDFASYGPPVGTVLPFGPAPFMPNRRYLQEVYAYYRFLYLQKPTVLLWPGLGKMPGASVYAGWVDAEHGRTLLPSWLTAPTLLANEVADFFQGGLMVGNYDIFDDLAWQFRAYGTSGIWAMRYVNAAGVGHAPARFFELPPWEDMWLGEHTGAAGIIDSANFQLTNREQEYIVQPAWNIFRTRGVVGIEYLIGILSESPLKNVIPPPGAKSFTQVVGLTKDITSFSDRWDWIIHPTEGIWHDWTVMPPAAKTGAVMLPLRTHAESYSKFYNFLGYPIIW